MRIHKNLFYSLLGIFFLGLVVVTVGLIVSRAKINQEAQTTVTQALSSPSTAATHAPPNPMVFLSSKQIAQFFNTNPAKDRLNGFIAHIAHLPQTSTPISVTSCALTPALTILGSERPITIKNVDSIQHTITYGAQKITLPAGSTQSITNRTKRGTLDTLSCDDSKYVGVIYTTP